MSRLSVLIPAYNPDAARLQRVLEALHAQTLDKAEFEVLLIDNASDRVDLKSLVARAPGALRLQLLHEPQAGLSHARRCGFRAARSELYVMVDDDNVLATDFLQNACAQAAQHPQLGCWGGRVRGEFEQEPVAWQQEFLNLLALVDHGPQAVFSGAAEFARARAYPDVAPVGAGMVLRRAVAEAWMQADAARAEARRLSDRKGNTTASSGDNDIVCCALAAGWDVAYFPELQLTHLIPASRLQTAALGRLNRGIQRSWMQLLRLHQINPWSELSTLGAHTRTWLSWWRYRAWRSPAHWVRWQGACGHYEGRIRLP